MVLAMVLATPLLLLGLHLAPASGSLPHGAVDTLVVETSYGNVMGFSRMVMGKKQYLFSGIPYAKPPVGNRRSVSHELQLETPPGSGSPSR